MPPPAGPLPADEVLLQALKQRRFVPYFEPKVSAETGRVAGFEVLARLSLDDGQMVSPSLFVPRLEALGQIDDLSLQLLDRALAALRGWLRLRPTLGIALNVSAESLVQPRVAAGLLAVTRAHEVSPERVVLEITESTPLAALSEGLESLVRLRAAGFQLAIDDFGTGHSSGEQLSRAPFTQLKIDQSFTRHAADNEEARIMFRSCMVVARKFGLRVCAEGVDSPRTLRFACDQGVHELQGWLISAAMPALAVPAFLDSFEREDRIREWYAAGKT